MRGSQGEDWEHEDVAADDDIDMGEGEDDPAADVSPVTRWAGGWPPLAWQELCERVGIPTITWP